MPKKKQVFTWPLSLLVIVVSFLSVLLVLEEVQAIWLEPYYLPSNTTWDQGFVFTPLAQDLDLGGHNITGNGNISINGSASFTSLTVNGVPYVPNSGGAGSNDWAINYSIADRPLFYTTTTPASGDVGIGTDNPSHRLHILALAENVEIDLQSGGAAGDNSHWGIYHDNVGATPSNDLRFWKGGADIVTFADSGELGIGTNSPAHLLHLYKTSGNNAEIDIQSTSGAGSYWGIYHDRATDQLRFWKSAGDNVLTLAANGRVAIGTTPDNSNILKVSTTTVGVIGVYGENLNSGTWPMNQNNVGVKGVATNNLAGGIGVYGSGYNGVKGLGTYGVYGESNTAGGYGVYGKKGTGAYAAYFEGLTEISGDLKVNGNLQISGSSSYLYINNGAGAPSLGCGLGAQGATYFDTTNNRLYICSTNSWRYVILSNL